MKRTILNIASILAIALVSLTLFSCTQPDNTPDRQDQNRTLSVASWIPRGTFKLSSAATEGTALEGEIEISADNIRFSQGGALDAPNAIIVDVATLYKNFYNSDPHDFGEDSQYGWYVQLINTGGWARITITKVSEDNYKLEALPNTGTKLIYTFNTSAEN